MTNEITFPILVPEHPDDPALIDMAREMEVSPGELLAQLQEWKTEEEGIRGAGWVSDGRQWFEKKDCTWVFRLIYQYPRPTLLDRPFKTSELGLRWPVYIPVTDDDPALLEMATAMEMNPADLRAQLTAWETGEDHKNKLGLSTCRYWDLRANGCNWEFCLVWHFYADGTLQTPCHINRVFVTHDPPSHRIDEVETLGFSRREETSLLFSCFNSLNVE